MIFLTAQNAPAFNCVTPNYNSNLVAIQCQTTHILTPEEQSRLPIVTIKLNFHWKQLDNNSQISTAEGDLFVNGLLDHANNKLSNAPANPIGPANYLGDVRYRYELYTDPNNTNDVHQGIWYWDKSKPLVKASDFPYQDNVLNVVITDDYRQDCVIRGDAEGFSRGYIELFRIQELLKCIDSTTNLPKLHFWDFSGVLNHEIGHTMTLRHSFEVGSCNDMDLVAEQNNGQPFSSGSTNMMGYNHCQCSFSPCQWATVYNYLTNRSRPKYVKDPCNNLEEFEDIIINNPGVVTKWDGLHVHNANIIVKTGSELDIECTLKMGPNKRIEVERGAKLVVNAGTITKLCEDPWDGIYVHGNSAKIQPDPETKIGNLLADDAGIAYFRNDSKIEWAYVAVSTSAPGYSYPDQVDRWGGVIVAKNTHFFNNKKSVEFLRYPVANLPMENKSYFQTCTFESNVSDYYDQTAITMWDVHGVQFFGNTFTNSPDAMNRYAISGIDYSAIIKDDNKFNKSKHAYIFSEATYPDHNSLWVEGNDFGIALAPSVISISPVTRAIYCQSGNNTPRKLKIKYNNFYDYRGGIYSQNSCNFEITGNDFLPNNTATAFNAINIEESGLAFNNIINCNSLKGAKGTIIYFKGDNSKTYFPRNTFKDKGATDCFRIFGVGQVKGKVNPTQPFAEIDAQGVFKVSQPNLPSSNEFFTTGRRINAHIANAQNFTYYIPNDRINKPHGSQYYVEPFVNTDVFTVLEKGAPKLVCSPTSFTTAGTGTIAVLRQQLDAINNQLLVTPTDESLIVQQSNISTELYERIRQDQLNFSEHRDYNAAVAQLLAQPEVEFRRNAYGLRVEEGNYQAALAILHNLPNQEQDDQWFREIQEINIRRFQTREKYQLSSSEEGFLNEVAHSESKERGYARALLDLLAGEREYPEYYGTDDAMYRNLSEYTRDVIQAEKSDNLAYVAPNPVTNDYFDINIKNINVKKGSISLSNLLGVTVYSQNFTAIPYERVNIDCSRLSPGLYAVRVMDAARTLYEGKISILK